jgi:hypothetical protein
VAEIMVARTKVAATTEVVETTELHVLN